MPARTKPRKYQADDLTHTVSEREYECWGLGKGDSYRLKCMECAKNSSFGNWYEYLYDTRAKDFYVCEGCYRKLFRNNDWKAWEVGY
jgi:hypothetical protein